jgi:hypothetical protein
MQARLQVGGLAGCVDWVGGDSMYTHDLERLVVPSLDHQKHLTFLTFTR